ncbi:MAG: carboxypeptidase-like regulatory domain-containing protein, partial [bacterium]
MFEKIGISLLNRLTVIYVATILLLTGGSLFAGTLSGKVTSTNGQALANVFIDMYDDTGEYFDYTVTDTAGDYKFSNLGTGGFYVHTDTLGEYVEEWYNTVPGASEDTFYDPLVAGATRVAVGSIETVAGINLTLDRAGSISGRITGTNGAGISRIYVDVYLPESSSWLRHDRLLKQSDLWL